MLPSVVMVIMCEVSSHMIKFTTEQENLLADGQLLMVL